MIVLMWLKFTMGTVGDSESLHFSFQRKATAKTDGDLILLGKAEVEGCVDWTGRSLEPAGRQRYNGDGNF